MVRNRPHLAALRSPTCNAWCAQVTVVPDSSSVRVFTSGSENVPKAVPLSHGNFLANARTRFYRLGELIAQINHVVQFWSFRSKGGRELIYDGDELAALLRDFEIGLGTDLINTQKAAVKPPPPPKPPQKTRLNVS